jgi:hypothetical protein
VTTVGQDFERQTNDLFNTTPKVGFLMIFFSDFFRIFANIFTSFSRQSLQNIAVRAKSIFLGHFIKNPTSKEKQGGLTEIPVYFNEMKKIIANKTTSARVR